MPLYEYNCHRCGLNFEVRQKFADEPLKVHPECGGEVERLISAPSLHFKGTGWYVTDYGRNGKIPSASNGQSDSKNDSKAESKGQTESKGETKTETKSEAKSETKTETKPAPAKT